ncbi:MAG: glycoside hydrolase family 2 TIM barrel-domain containing protein [Bacteroides sp.]|nr:glycoside hydrolase family 2 TIM barrel-domain containing protein [Bacteroides sp.]
MKAAHWIVLVLTMMFAVWFVYRTRDSEPRIESALDLNWRFVMGDPEGAGTPGYDDSQWRYVSVPHDWMIEQPVEISNESGIAGGYYPGGIGWYRKSLDMSTYEEQEHFYLLFEGVYRNADVYFNGTLLGNHAYGYTSFYYDISELVRRDTLNIIAVRTDCSKMPNDRWYSGAGIFRPVKLIASTSLHIPPWGNWISSTIDSTGKAQINVSTEIQNTGRKARRFEIRYDIVGPGGRLAAEGKLTSFVDSRDSDTILNHFQLDDPLLWSPESPNLYVVNCYLMDGNKQIDHTQTIHGIRSALFDPDHGFLLNGEKKMLKGVNLHHDGGELGAAVPLESWRRRLLILKELGVNALRLAHNPHAPGMLDLCDELGFLVIDEMYDKWEDSWWKGEVNTDMAMHWESDLADFVRRDRNHPSVILWSVGNETVEQLSNPEKGVEIYSSLLELVKSIDPTREVSCGLHPGKLEKGQEVPSSLMHVSPVVSYNYRTDSFSTWHAQYPNLIFIASETKAYATETPEDYRQIDYSGNSWNDMEEFVAGQFIWAGIDYLGESGGWPERGWGTGLMLTNGFIKPHSWYIGSMYREDPMVKLTVLDTFQADAQNNLKSWQKGWLGAPLVDHWTFGPECDSGMVVVFTNCKRIDLKLNNKLITTLERSAFADGVIRSNVSYEPGELVATAFFEDEFGKERQVTDTLHTAEVAYALAMNSDRQQVSADSREVVHITTSAVDSTGTLNPFSQHKVNYTLDGPGRIRVIDNGDLGDHTEAGSSSRKLRRGKQLLILQAGSEPGDLIINASAEGLKSSRVKIKANE